MSSRHPHSIHSFMFPVRWDVLPDGYDPDNGKESIEFDIRTNLRLLAEKLRTTSWKRVFYRINNDPLQYNEISYFHAYTTKSIFDLQQPDEKDETVLSESKTMAYFEIATAEGDYYQIEAGNNITYLLKLTGLSLHAYNTGVAILTFNLENHQYPQPDDVLCINEMGRRIYPLFLGIDVPFTTATKKAVLAQCIELKCGEVNDGIPVREDFSQYDLLTDKETHRFDKATNIYQYNSVIDFPEHFKALFNKSFVYNAHDEKGGDKVRFNILTDDRMFFQCWYGNKGITDTLKEELTYYDGVKGYNFAQNNFWYAFMHGDKNKDSLGIANKYLMQKEILNHTYTRWAAYGTLYGFTRDSFVAVSDEVKVLLEIGVPIHQHFKTIYYQMAVLCLAQRAGVLRFAAEVSSITQLGKTHEKEALVRIQQLYLNYIEFINTLCYREISPQMQGIDIYTMFRKAMNIPEDVKNLDEEIEELHSFAMFAEQKRAADKSERLSKIATMFLPATVIIGLMGVNVLSPDNMYFGEMPDWNAWAWIITGCIISILITVFLLRKKKN